MEVKNSYPWHNSGPADKGAQKQEEIEDEIEKDWNGAESVSITDTELFANALKYGLRDVM